MRLAQISDLHFGSFSLSPMQFLSKRWLGNFNYLLKRKKEFHYNRLIELIDLFKKEGVTHVLITGDLSVTSRKIEFEMAKRFLQLLKKEGMTVFTIPGNHDHYTRRSHRSKRFYKFFNPYFSPEGSSLQNDCVSSTKLSEGLWLVGIDTALATSLVSSQGNFSPQVEKNLKNALDEIPKEDRVILMNHFPFFATDPKKKQLLRGNVLKELLKDYPNILIYAHGHTHRQTVADLRESDLPIVSDTGSTPHVRNGAFHIMDIEPKQVTLDVYRHKTTWKKDETHTFDV